MNLPALLASYRKYLLAAVTVAGALLAANIITGQAAVIVSSVIGALGTLGVGAIPNKLTPKQLLAQPAFSPARSHVPMPLGHPDAIKAALTWSGPTTAPPTGTTAAEHVQKRGPGGRFSK